MIKFYDPSGASHFGQASITKTTSVNGGLSLTGEVFDGDDVLNGLDYGWWLNFDNEKYVITYKKLSDDTNTIVFDAVQQFFWDFAKVALHSQYTGSHEYAFYLNQLFNGSGYTYQNDVTVPAFEKENWGYKNKLSLFNDIMDQADVEFEVHNETVHIAKQIGSDLTSFVRKGINLSDLTEEIKISDFATYAKGYGAFGDPQDPSKGRLEVEYRSELADKFGVLEMDPIVDERYTIANNLIAELKKKIDATYTVSMTMNIYDLESAGYPNYESPKVGDWILAIDEALNFKRKIRIIKLEEQFDVTGKRIGYTATCGDLSIVDQYTNLQGSLDSKVQRIQESIDSVAASANGKNSNYYGAKEPVNANEGDLWFDQSNSDPDKWTIKQWLNWRWEQITLNPGEVADKVAVAKAEAEKAVDNAKSASYKADQLASKYDDTNSLASQAMNKAVSAQGDASSAVSAANSTASEFGKVNLKADSAVASALNAQSDASDAVKQASSAAADSKDAKQISGAVRQSYKTLTDGSTMTIAELQNGLAYKLTKADLDGYATQTWTQNQIKVTADGINGTMSSIKSTVDSQTTSINDLKADSSSFKSQFTTVNNTLGKQTTDISTLQASSKELTSGFNTLTSDNTTNKSDISELKQTATEVSSTLETVQTQVQNSAVGTNLLLKTGTPFSMTGNNTVNQFQQMYALSRRLEAGTTVTLSFDAISTASAKFNIVNNGLDGGVWTVFVNAAVADTTKEHYVVTATLAGYADLGVNMRIDNVPSTTTITVSNMKLELGSKETDYSTNPADNATVAAFSKLSQTVDRIKIDISKKIEQKDLNGYATQTWAQNQIKTTADGISGTLSTVKTTVDRHDTSINEIKADSSSFKTQFTTVNGTIEKQSTDISTLQVSSKSLSANFDSLSSDNQTNQHNISQLQASADTFNSTLMTVQTQVQNSAVGTNLLLKTGTELSMTGNNTVNQIGYAYSLANGYNVSSLALALGTQFTISFDWSVSGNAPSGEFGIQWNDVPWATGLPLTSVSSSNVSGHISGTFNVSTDSTNIANAVGLRLDNFIGTITISNVKLEKGGLATDWCPNPADNATVDAVSSISQTIDSIQTTVRGKADQSKIDQLDNQITSVVGQVNNLGQRNLIYNSELRTNTDGWESNANIWVGDNQWDHANGSNSLVFNPSGFAVGNWSHVYSKMISTVQGMQYSASATLFTSGATPPTATTISLEINFFDDSGNRVGTNAAPFDISKCWDHQLLKIEGVTTPTNATQVCLAIQMNGDGYLLCNHPMMVSDSTVGAYLPDTVGQSEYSQLEGNINLKVSKDGVINAINVSNEGTSIYGNKLHITADTYIDNATIKSAMIDYIDATKIKVGTLDATKVDIIHLNADNITAGIINGSNLTINLDNGNVEFQKGRIHSADNAIDINIDNKYISVASDSNRVMLKNGEMQFVEPTLFDTEDSPYFRIHNRGGYAYGGAEMVGRDYVTVSNDANSSDFFTYNIGVETFSGLFTGYDRASNAWRPTKVAGAERGVIISGGSGFSTTYIPNLSPRIIVGYDNNSSNLTGGNRILLDADFVHSFPTYKKTISASSNVHVAEDGALVRTTSASKYKTNIERSFETEMGERILEVPTAHWLDKAEVRKKTLNPKAPDPRRYFGMIADDIDEAGLTELVEYNDKGEVEGLMYDRIALTLIPLIRDYRNRIIELETEVKKMKEV